MQIESVEERRTLTWTQIGFGSEKVSEKQVSSGPQKEKVSKVQVRSRLLSAPSEPSYTVTSCPLGPAPHPEHLGLEKPRLILPLT